MKKSLILLAVAALSLFSCIKFENDTPDPQLAVPSIDITIDSKADSTFTFTVKPGDGTGYYSYTVLKGAAKYLDSTKVLGVSCKGISEATQTMEKKPSVTVTLTESDGILPNTTYTVYAVAANAQSLVSAVKSVTVLTTDKNIPSPVKAAVSSTSAGATVTFNETVSRGEGKAFAHYYKVWAPGTEAMKVELGEENIVVDGAGVTFSAPDTVSGAYVFFTWEEGLVKNAVGTKCPEYQTVVFSAKNGAAVTSQCRGIMSRWPVTTFGWTRMCYNAEGALVSCPEDSVVAFTDYKDALYVLAPDSTIVSGSNQDIVLTYANKSTSTAFNDYVNAYDAYTGKYLYLSIAKYIPSQGDYLNWSIAEKSFYDVWGNYSEAYENEDNYLYSYGYTVDDFCGTFEFNAGSNNTGTLYNDTLVIEKASGNTVTVKGMGVHNPGWGTATFTPEPIKAVVDGVYGTLTISSGAMIGGLVTAKGTEYDLGLAGGDWGGTTTLTDVQFTMPEKGEYTYGYSYFYVMAFQSGVLKGYWDVIFPFSFGPVSAAPTSLVPASFPKIFNDNVNTTFKRIDR